jgi:hypothetical protein
MRPHLLTTDYADTMEQQQPTTCENVPPVGHHQVQQGDFLPPWTSESESLIALLSRPHERRMANREEGIRPSPRLYQDTRPQQGQRRQKLADIMKQALEITEEHHEAESSSLRNNCPQ